MSGQIVDVFQISGDIQGHWAGHEFEGFFEEWLRKVPSEAHIWVPGWKGMDEKYLVRILGLRVRFYLPEDVPVEVRKSNKIGLFATKQINEADELFKVFLESQTK